MYKTIIFIVGLLICISCNNNRNIDIKNKTVSFKVAIDATNKLDSFTIPPVLLKERKIVATDQYLISLNIESDTLFRVFDLTDHRYVGSFGTNGRGPLDFYNVNIGGFRAIKGGCIVTDIRNVSVIEFPDRNIKSSTINFKKQYPVPNQLIPLNQAMVVSDTLICGSGSHKSDKELSCFNPKTDRIRNFIDYPKTDLNPTKEVLSVLFWKQLNCNYDGSKIVIAYRNFPLIRIFSNTGQVLNEILVNEAPEQKEIVLVKNGIQNGRDLYSYYSTLEMTNNYIYALFEPSQIKLKYEGGNEYINVPIQKKQILIFDLNGNPKAKIILDDWMTIFTPTMDDKYIYFVNPLRSDKIYRLPLTTIL